MGESVFPLNDKDREEAVEIAAAAMRPTLGPEWVKWNGGGGIAGLALDALESAGYVILPPGHATIEDRGRWSSRDVLHRRVVGSWQPAENP